jgi:hypothetical protein
MKTLIAISLLMLSSGVKADQASVMSNSLESATKSLEQYKAILTDETPKFLKEDAQQLWKYFTQAEEIFYLMKGYYVLQVQQGTPAFREFGIENRRFQKTTNLIGSYLIEARVHIGEPYYIQ